MEFKCNTCDVIFNKSPSRECRTNNHYCSRICWRNREIEKKYNCMNCLKIIDEDKRWSKSLCLSCGKKEWRKTSESYKSEKKKIRDATRIKRGLSIDHPPLKRKNGEGSLTEHGYRVIWKPGHPNCTSKAGRIYEHIWMMSESLKRPLYENEIVHHKNGIRSDNRIENLELWDCNHPYGQRVDDKIVFYKEFLEKHGYVITKE